MFDGLFLLVEATFVPAIHEGLKFFGPKPTLFHAVAAVGGQNATVDHELRFMERELKNDFD